MVEKKETPPKKERFRNFIIKFNEPFSNLVLASLPEKTNFITKYRDFNIIKNNDNVMGMLFKDSLDIFYNLSNEELAATSPVRDDEKVIERLEETANRILKLYDIEGKPYKLIEGDDFEYLENYNLQDKIEKNLFRVIQNEFQKEGTMNLTACVLILKTKDKDVAIRLSYTTPADLEKRKLLIECDKNFIGKVVEVLNK